MKRNAPALSVSQLSLYNPSRMTDPEIIASFAARQAVFERILADIAREKPRSRAQHHLLVGQRGMGKSTLLARLGAELREKTELADRYVPLVFAEEQYAVDRLSKFWLNCLDSLADACERAGDNAATERIDYAVQQLSSRTGGTVAEDQERAAAALDAFLSEAKALNRRPVLLVDNLQLVFERISAQQQHVLREVLMRPGGPLLVGTSPSPPSETTDYGAAFYDHFKVHYLSALSVEEMRQLMLTLAERAERPDIRDRIQRHPHRLEVLRQLTGGNPRTTVTLFFLYAEDFAPSVFGDLENLLDRVTPLYKARFEELSPQQQVVASAIANHWDPVTARALAEASGLAVTGISPQLDRLEKIGFIERVQLFGESSTGYQIAERFFNVWFLMRSASRRQRREVEFLTRFIENFYEAKDRSRLASHLQTERNFSPDRQLFVRALACTIDPTEARDLKRHAELDALRQKDAEARRELEEVIDFSQLPPAALAFNELREKLMSLVPRDANIDHETFAELVLGDRRMFESNDRKRLASRTCLTVNEIRKTMASMKASRKTDEAKYGQKAVRWVSLRLSSGQLADFEELGDWDAAFIAARERREMELLLNMLSPRIGLRLANESCARIRAVRQPEPDDRGWKWYNWGYDLHKKLGKYEEAEEVYRKAICLDQEDAYPWNALGLLLQDHLGRYEEAEDAYRRAISLDEKYAYPWNNLGNLLQDYLGRYEEAENAYRRAILLDKKYAQPWIGLGNLLENYLGRHEEAENACRKAISLDEKDAYLWNELGNLLQNHLDRYEEAEGVFRKAISLDEKYAHPWNNLGNLYCDHLNRYFDAAKAFESAWILDPLDEIAPSNLLFLRRDFLGDGRCVLPLFEKLLELPKLKCVDTNHLHHALFVAYEDKWGLVRESLVRALTHAENGFPVNTADDWLRASAVLLHLDYGDRLLVFLQEQGADKRLRPWYEALVALQMGERRKLQNLAPEIRTTAEIYFDQIEKRLKALPESTRRRPLPEVGKRKRRVARGK